MPSAPSCYSKTVQRRTSCIAEFNHTLWTEPCRHKVEDNPGNCNLGMDACPFVAKDVDRPAHSAEQLASTGAFGRRHPLSREASLCPLKCMAILWRDNHFPNSAGSGLRVQARPGDADRGNRMQL